MSGTGGETPSFSASFGVDPGRKLGTDPPNSGTTPANRGAAQGKKLTSHVLACVEPTPHENEYIFLAFYSFLIGPLSDPAPSN